MVEQTKAGKRHDHAVFVAALDHQIIPDGAAGLCNIGHTAALSPIDIVTEGKECIGTQRHTADGIQVSPLLFPGKRFRTL